MGRTGYDMHGRVALGRERWRDVAAAYLVHTGLRLATVVARREIVTTLARECEQSATRGAATTKE